MIKIKKSEILFVLSNLLFFNAILFTYLDLKKYRFGDIILPHQFSFSTYLLIVLFLVNLLFIYFINRADKYKIFCIFVYYQVLSSGIFIINFPLMDELILHTSSLFFF